MHIAYTTQARRFSTQTPGSFPGRILCVFRIRRKHSSALQLHNNRMSRRPARPQQIKLESNRPAPTKSGSKGWQGRSSPGAQPGARRSATSMSFATHRPAAVTADCASQRRLRSEPRRHPPTSCCCIPGVLECNRAGDPNLSHRSGRASARLGGRCRSGCRCRDRRTGRLRSRVRRSLADLNYLARHPRRRKNWVATAPCALSLASRINAETLQVTNKEGRPVTVALPEGAKMFVTAGYIEYLHDKVDPSKHKMLLTADVIIG